MLISLKHSILNTGTVSLLSLSSLALANPSYAVSIDLTSWNKIGDVNPITSDQATLNSGTLNTVATGGGAGSLEEFLGVSAGSLDPDPDNFVFSTFGSAIKTTFAGIQAGDVFNFEWSFSTSDPDSAFVTINNLVIPLAASGKVFKYPFTKAGNYSVGIGIVDVNDAIGGSQFTVSNANLKPVPEPLTILGSLTALSFGVAMRSRFGKKNSV
ncbi:PEP-CTERM sorting domain-containing protein [Halotia branconii]|uniref:PEP-CTERM sorting domain-containing protein n=1 Tax=Halotia branconii CENA392 TaxID=1539056 RepID=A0AAJ6NX64_9CYAN|nr:PEP-CTERM sorting domain-containing protein [Halotia branconii]WGV28053.1 PEP-CTERM sorting domain-containing protein [Halotia branconii CENA392]